jgi:hypothetical protein
MKEGKVGGGDVCDVTVFVCLGSADCPARDLIGWDSISQMHALHSDYNKHR